MGRPLLGQLMGILDPIEVLAGFAWQSATVELDEQGRLQKVKAPKADDGTDRGLPALDLNPAHWGTALIAALAQVEEALGAEGIQFKGGTIRCQRTDLQSVHIELINTDGSTALEVDIPTSTARGQLLNDELVRILVNGAPIWAEQQRKLREDLGGLARAAYTGDRNTVRFEFDDGGCDEVSAQILGSYAYDEYTWLWSWANPSYEPSDFQRVAELRDRMYQAVGAGALWRPGFCCDERFAMLIAQLAGEQLDAFSVFAPKISETQRVYYALFG